MSMWTALALMAIASIAAGAWRHRGTLHDDKVVEELKQRIDSLEQELGERIETLERIVTDKKEDLKRQFDYLDKAS